MVFFLVLFVFVCFSVSYSSDPRISEKGGNTFSCSFGKRRGGGVSGGGGGGGEPVSLGYVFLKVYNANSSSPVSGAQVYVNGTPVAFSSESGTVYFSVAPGDYKLKVVAPSFAPYTFKIRVLKDEISRFDVRLAPYSFSASFDASVGGVIKDTKTGLKIVFQGGGLRKKSDNSIYSGEATLSIAYLDPQRVLQLFGFPGNFVGVQSNGERVLLETFGPIEARIISQFGEELDLPEGVTAYIEFPVPDSLRDVVPSEVPLWSFDETRGEWVYEGVLSKGVNEDGKEVLYGYVSHFSWWNPDIPSDTTCVQGVIKDYSGNPISGVQVWSEGVDYTGADYTGTTRKTGADGRFFVFVRKGAKAKLVANINGIRKELGEIQTQVTYPSYYLKDWYQDPESAWSICPDIGEFFLNQLKIILRWGNKRCDLDLHITGPSSSGRFHVATKLWGQVNSNPYVEIEGDDYPEYAYIDPVLAGVYRVSVFHNNPNDKYCGRLLKDSGALMQVWYRGKVVFTASPPSSGSGDLWKAIDIVVSSDGSVSITEIGEIVDGDYCAPYHPDSGYESGCPVNNPPLLSLSVPAEADGSSVVYIPYVVSDPDGDDVRIYAFGDVGEFDYGDGFIGWHTPDVKRPKEFRIVFSADDRRGGVVSQAYSIIVKPNSVYRVWETVGSSGGSVFFDPEVSSDGSVYVINDQWWDDYVLRIVNGKIQSQRAYMRVFDIAVTGDSVYIAYDLGSGIFGLGRYSLDLGTAIWETTLTTSGRYFVKLQPVSDGIYVVFSTASNYVIRKYSFSGTVIWETTSPRAGDTSRCHDRCIKVNPANGEIYISIFEDSSSSDQSRILRLSSSGTILSTKIINDWSPVIVYPYGNSVYVVRLWIILEVYDQNLSTPFKTINISSDLEEFWISELFVHSGFLYAVGGKSFYNSNMEFVRESMAFMKFDLNLNVIYGKVLGLSSETDSDRLFGATISDNYLYVAGGLDRDGLYLPFVAKYKFQ